MSNKTLFVINEQSQLERWDITRRKMNINKTLIDGLSASVIRKIPNAIAMSHVSKGEPGHVGLAIGSNGQMVARMQLFDIPMAAPFAIEGDLCYPHFDGDHPVMALRWKCPSTMYLFLCVQLDASWRNCNNYLVALDANHHAWRLPLSNLYADCRLCSGRYEDHASDIVGACRLCWGQFQASKWNQDLYTDATDNRRSASKTLFKYKVKGDIFEQPETPKNWQTLCEKVGTPFIGDFVAY